jgi:hypothetical protein
VSARNLFHVSGNGNAADDQSGNVLSRLEVAVLAAFVASELAQDGELKFMVYAVDEYGTEIIKVSDTSTRESEAVVRCGT